MNENIDFSNILKIFENNNNLFEEILEHELFKQSILTQNNKILDFIYTNLLLITNIGLEIENHLNLNIINICKWLITLNNNFIITKFSSNIDFLLPLSNFLKEFDSKNLLQINFWCKVLNLYIQLTNGAILHNFPEKKFFFNRILPYIQIYSINSLLITIVDDGHSIMLEFLTKIHACSIIFNFLGPNSPNELLLQLMTSIVSSSDPGSSIIRSLSKESKLNTIFYLAIKGSNQKVCDNAMKLLFELCSHCDEEDNDNENSLFQLIFMKVVNKIDELVEFINNKPFSLAHEKAIELIIGMISTLPEIPDIIYSILNNLWIKFLKYPNHSILHCSFLKLFKALIEINDYCKNFLIENNIRNIIINEFLNNNLRINYKGHLIEMIKLILLHETQEEFQIWNNFINNNYLPLKKIINYRYGGNLPKKHKVSFDDFNIEGKIAK